MIRERLVATWLVADPMADATEIQTWCHAAARDEASDALIQVATGRGRLAGGRGALIVGDRESSDSDSRPGWCSDRFSAGFQLRQVHAPRAAPEVARTPAMLLTRTYVPEDMRDEFRDWLEREHSQRQLDVPGNNWYLGYEEIGGRRSFMNLWGIDDPGVADGDAWDQSRLTPWRERMLPAMAGMDRAFYQPIERLTSD